VGVAKEILPGRVYSKELIELLFCQPYTKGQFLEHLTLAANNIIKIKLTAARIFFCL